MLTLIFKKIFLFLILLLRILTQFKLFLFQAQLIVRKLQISIIRCLFKIDRFPLLQIFLITISVK
jgi:hypothetical protein